MVAAAGFANVLLGISDLAAYKRGDLDGGLDVDIDDFSLFKSAFDLSNVAGAFAALTNRVPEATASTLVILFCFLGHGGPIARRVSRRCTSASVNYHVAH